MQPMQTVQAMPATQATQVGHQVKLINIPPELTARDLAEAFGKISQNRVESVEVLRDSNGAATSESYIVFNTAADAHNAVRRYNGGDLNGRRIRVVYEGEVSNEAGFPSRRRSDGLAETGI